MKNYLQSNLFCIGIISCQNALTSRLKTKMMDEHLSIHLPRTLIPVFAGIP